MPRQSESTLAAIKQAIDIVALVGEYLPLHRAGGKFKALCPFHDDHNPSLELNSERRSFKCWSCGAGGDVFDFVKDYERVDFSEAVRMLAERAGIALDRRGADDESSAVAAGPSKSDLLAACAWAEGAFAEALAGSAEARSYVASRGISGESVARFGLGFAPDRRDWLSLKGARAGFGIDLLEKAGLVARKEGSSLTRDRFRGRLIFPIRDPRGRPIGFGGRILPESEKRLAENGLNVAKYLNSPETPLFQKRRTLYAADLAREAARRQGWTAVVEGYTDVIAAHQAGLSNVVGTLGTALGDDHVTALRRLADRVVLVFDGDEAGQKAADRSLEFFLGHEVDVRVLTLPDGLDPADFLAREGPEAFRTMLEGAPDALEFVLDRASERFDFESAEGARQAAGWVLSLLAKVPKASGRSGLGFKVDAALDRLSRRLGIPQESLRRGLRREQNPPRPAASGEPKPAEAVSEAGTVHLKDLDPVDRELVEIALNEPEAVGAIARKVAADDLADPPLRQIMQALFDLLAEGEAPEFSRAALRLSEADRGLAAGLLLPIDPDPLPEAFRPASWSDRLAGIFRRLDARRWEAKLRDLKGALAEIDPRENPDDHRALHAEYLRHLVQRPDPRKTSSS